MRNNQFLLLTAIICSTFILGCSSSKLIYQIDPDFSQLSSALESKEIVYVEVIDNRVEGTDTTTLTLVNADIPDHEALKSKLTQFLKDNHFKIINRVLLADIGLEIKIIELNLSVASGFLKSKLTAQSELEMIIHKKSERWSKTYKTSRSQEVANPVDEFDATGVMNQMLSKQFHNIFTDKELIDFISL
ncbi:MAG: hypothetical protein COB38_01385 [Gammaproteobacteria bacterium]|nr:MAG: hypothetical protein COB38_01385 [Gammaproteobacteria bacterium]